MTTQSQRRQSRRQTQRIITSSSDRLSSPSASLPYRRSFVSLNFQRQVLLLLLVFLLLIWEPKQLLVHAEDQTIAWMPPGGGVASMPPRTAYVGDTFTFLFETGAHNVYIHPTEECDPSGSYLVGMAGEGATRYTFQERDVGRRVFACQIGNHCYSGGQILTVMVYPSTSEDDADDADGTSTTEQGAIVTTADKTNDTTTSGAVLSLSSLSWPWWLTLGSSAATAILFSLLLL